MRFTYATGTNQGRVRDTNQDTVHPETGGTADDSLLIAVADGMGGHSGGEVASRDAMDAAVGLAGDRPSVDARIIAANEAVLSHAQADWNLAGMGTTMTMAELSDDGRLILGHVGDSRAYLLRDGVLAQLTDDHTFVAEQVRAGRLTMEDARTHPRRSMLTRAVGLARDLGVDVMEERIESGDRLMLCSDGLSNMVLNEEIAEILGMGTAEEAVWALIEAANQAGGHDNISVAIVDAI